MAQVIVEVYPLCLKLDARDHFQQTITMSRKVFTVIYAFLCSCQL